MEGNMTEIFQVAADSVNIQLVIVLMALGAVLKHAIKQLDNGRIPLILMGVGVLLSVVVGIDGLPGNLLTSIAVGCVSAAFAIGAHSTGKSMWELFGFKFSTQSNPVLPGDSDNSSESE